MAINTKGYWLGNAGMTMVEILVTLCITGIVSGAIFSVYKTSLSTYTSQTQVADVQQDLRAGLFIMTRELRMAGYDITGLADTAINITSSDFTPGTNRIQFTADLNGDGDLVDTDDEDGDGDTTEADQEENVTYALYTSDGIQKLGRTIAGSPDPLVENAEALGFAYAIDDGNGRFLTNASGTVWAVIGANGNWYDLDYDEDGDVDTADDVADGAADGVVEGIDLGIAADTEDIRAVRIWLLARTQVTDNDFSNDIQYVVGNNILTYNDNFRRRLLTATVKCRNMGL